MSINEWEFTADIASWLNRIIEHNPSLPYTEAKCEQQGTGSRKRRDLTLLDKNGRIVLTGEVKLPYQADGGSPHNEKVVKDAREKARRAQANYFFTWNVNEFVLWETFPTSAHRRDWQYKSWNVTNVAAPEDLDHPAYINDIKDWLPEFLNDFANLLRGRIQIGVRPPDERFIEALESSLRMPINLTLERLLALYNGERFRSTLDKWMREEQGWVISHDPETIRVNLETASKFACYALVNKLVFYEALLKRYATRLPRLNVPDHIETGDELRLHLERFFIDARRETGDYETVFGEDHQDTGNRIPFFADKAVPHWRELINQIHQFDFSKLDYEVIGSIFERLISPQERHKYGQYYTKPQVVDLINSFCIRNADDKVMDPACGGGTFLVRAYARKREMDPSRKHAALLGDLFGVDISHFAAHLTTVNLATRDLIDDENYPLVSRSDFFDIMPDKPFLFVPHHARGSKIMVKGMGKIQHKEVDVPELDAVIGNPPYVRQEDLKKSSGRTPEKGTKEYYAQVAGRVWSDANLSGRSDLHCYFWLHGTSFLKKDGYFGFLTSSQWLDVEYGFRLQDWILRHFEIVAIIESVDEPWFVGARVVTTITILKRQDDESQRMNNLIRFVQLRRPIQEILVNDGTTFDEVKVADRFRDEILGLEENTLTERYRARVVKQQDIWNEGVHFGSIMVKSGEANEDEDTVGLGIYYGGKWGVYLRAPDLWFDMLEETANDRWAALGEICQIKRGVTTGRDDFFYVRDVTDEYLSKYKESHEFQEEVGYPRRDFSNGRVRLVKCGEGQGELKPIESAYLEPEVHSLMEISRYSVKSSDCSRKILLVGDPKSDLEDTYVGDYIEWGERQGYHEGSTCAARASDSRAWYDLTGHKRAPVLWAKERQYRQIAPANEDRLIGNCRLYEIYPPEEVDDPDLWGGILNSSWVLLSTFQYGRPVGNEGNWSTMVVDVNMMLVPDPRKATEAQRNRVREAFRKIKGREALAFLSEQRLRQMAYLQKGILDQLGELSDQTELDMKDRQELDDAVLAMTGIRSKQRREELRDSLYNYLRETFEQIRRKEEKAIVNKKKSKRKGPPQPGEIAAQIFAEVVEKHPRLLRKYDPDFLNLDNPYIVFDLPLKGEPEVYSDMFVPCGVRFALGKKYIAQLELSSSEQAGLVKHVAQSGRRGLLRFPTDKVTCKQTMTDYSNFLAHRDTRLKALVDERTADEEMQVKILDALRVYIENAMLD